MLGEGPLWDPRIDTLYWVDILAGTVFAQAVGTGRPIRIDIGGQIGAVAETVSVPVLRPTSVAFGGPGLRTMYITSASVGLTQVQLAEWPLSGSVLRRAVGTPGRPSSVFHLARGVAA
jgi:sugar lactone lactonase YvrE